MSDIIMAKLKKRRGKPRSWPENKAGKETWHLKDSVGAHRTFTVP